MLRDLIINSIKQASGIDDISLEFPENEEFGDYSSNIALQAFTIIKTEKWPDGSYIGTRKHPSIISGKNSKEMAINIVEKLRKDKELSKIIGKIEVAGPGFINFYLSNEALEEEFKRIIKDGEEYGSLDLGNGKAVVIDYSSPNIAKRFGIGHLRSTVIGQALYNLYKRLGYKVIGDNHLGDWGTQFGALLYQITSQNLDPAKLSIDKLEELYVDFHKKEADDPSLHDEAKMWFKKLEDGDDQARKIWEEIVKTSLAEFERIYEILGVAIDYAYGESFYDDKMPAVIEELTKKNLIIKSEGALIVELPGMPPGIIVKSDGTTTYLTRDLATIKFRLGEWGPDLFIYEVGADQTLHFRQLFEIARLLGWIDKKEFVHVAHGLIRFAHGKMSTRRGESVKLEDVLNEAIQRAKGIIEKSETGRGLSEKEKEEVAKAVGIGAIKYFDLMHQPLTDIIFDWEKIFVLEGNSAPYLQYTVARTNSVLAKAGNKSSSGAAASLNNEELVLLRTLVRFPEMIGLAAKNYSPNLLANYLFELAQKYNNFYNQHRIIGGENEKFRLILTSATGQVLKNGLVILGIETPEKM